MKWEGCGGKREAACFKELGKHYFGGRLARLRTANKNLSELGNNLGQKQTQDLPNAKEQH
jgi:hypothetical protein